MKKNESKTASKKGIMSVIDREKHTKINGIQLLWLVTLLMLPGFQAQAQNIPHYPDSLFSTYYHQKASQYHLLPHREGEVIFLGNSITDGGSWNELFQDNHMINRGISGDVTKGVLNRLDDIVNRKPKKVFLLIGTNDLARGIDKDTVLQNTLRIVSLLHHHSPQTKVYVQSIFPVNKKGSFPGHAQNKEKIKYINRHLAQFAEEENYTYIDLYEVLKNEDDEMNMAYSNDGLHLLGKGYMAWKHQIYPYVYDLQKKPSILPKPQYLKEKKGKFPLFKSHEIVVLDDSLKMEAQILQNILTKKGVQTTIEAKEEKNQPVIELKLGEVEAEHLPEEAYSLKVTDNKIEIKGNTSHGVFNGIQTLRQLIRDGVFVDGVTIKDWPAFSWRGYLVDVGRNYQSIAQLKQQIDEMAHYKLNVFHFHPTEDVAWRFQIQRYPELTDQKNMTRDEGLYYTIDQIKELIRYAKKRHITFVPEIDMPGHSEAFKKAMGVDMQSKEGITILKNIITEIDSTYEHIPYIHIGADEVEITNKQFIPEMVDFIHQQGKETIGWAPGGNYDQRTIRQLWKGKAPEFKNQAGQRIKNIDSRALYINHKDPMSGVISIFDRQIGDVNKSNKSILGGEIALWNDNRAAKEKDILRMNLVYPAMLAFAERSWQGGGFDNVVTDLGAKTSTRHKDFSDFEKRVLDQKTEFFKQKPFPYLAQSDIQWQLFGPFENEGELTKKFWPEKNATKLENTDPKAYANGATVWLRHFFDPIVKGALKNPKPHTTWYGYRKIYSDTDQIAKFWIGFDNPSRSYATTTPPKGKWDDRESKLWINGHSVTPPEWTYPGRNGTQEDPLIDEGYEYRAATKVELHKGWNTILVKAPVGSFQGKSWQHPVKWMFTVIQVPEEE